MEERELKSLPQEIERLESRHEALCADMADPAFYKRPKEEMARVKSELETLEGNIETAYQRWETLEQKKGGA
jgi:ATP-binding cassette subfamily F protein uup